MSLIQSKDKLQEQLLTIHYFTISLFIPVFTQTDSPFLCDSIICLAECLTEPTVFSDLINKYCTRSGRTDGDGLINLFISCKVFMQFK